MKVITKDSLIRNIARKSNQKISDTKDYKVIEEKLKKDY